MTRVRLLAVSPPCHQPVNRAIYRELVERHGVTVHLALPRQLYVGNQWRDTPQGPSGPYTVTMLKMQGEHGRLQRLQGLEDLARKWLPTHILADNDPATLMTWQAAKAARVTNAKVWSLTAENLIPHYGRNVWTGLQSLKPSRIAGPLLTWALRTLVHPRVDRVFTLSREGTRVMEALGFKGRVTQIPLGFDPSLFRIQNPEQVAATRSRLKLNQPTVAYFGRLTPEKGVHLLLKALASIKDTSWQFLIDHFSEYQTSYTALLQAEIETLGIRSRTTHFDARHDEMPNYMNAADIVVLPSISTLKWKEQYGRVMPEAMACGKIVVGSDSGAIPEVMADHGRIFPEGDETALAKVLRELLGMNESQRRELGQRASAYAQANFSITRQAQIWAGLLS